MNIPIDPNKMSPTIEQIFNDKFMQSYTPFSSFADFITKCNLNKDLSKNTDDKLNECIKAHTQFSDFKDFKTVAKNLYIQSYLREVMSSMRQK